MCGEENSFCTGLNKERPRQDKNLLYRPVESNEPTNNNEGPLSFVLRKSPFTLVSTAGRSHPSLVSLLQTVQYFCICIEAGQYVSRIFLTQKMFHLHYPHATGHCSHHHEELAQKKDECAHGIDGGNAQNVCSLRKRRLVVYNFHLLYINTNLFYKFFFLPVAALP
jgi:hypothetical protein